MQTFYGDCLNNLQELHNDVAKTIEGLPLEALDWSPRAGVNSITVLIVHLTGSQRFLFGEVIGGQDIHRDRDAEFLAKGIAPDALIQRLNDNLQYIEVALDGLTLADLERKCMFRTREVTVGWVIGHSLKHTATHLGHIQVMRDLWEQFK
ncbi:MAG TPA: DinB family protein [Anaerolineales bacterium]|nr:DinB family protein [Anaerolineales bacterium]